MNRISKGAFVVLTIILSAFVAIMVHAFLPAGVKEEEFDSLLVRVLGFKGTAVLYFLILYSHIAFVVNKYGCDKGCKKKNACLRLGVSFALLYMVGMQEIVLKPSPFNAWGSEFIRYQLIMGLGDAMPVLLLCVIIAKIADQKKDSMNNDDMLLAKSNSSSELNNIKKWMLRIGVYSGLILVERLIMNSFSLIDGNFDQYPIQTIVWTILFGVVLGTMNLILEPLFHDQSRWKMIISFNLMILGLNWGIFNGFMGMISKGIMPHILLRVGVDAIVFLLAGIAINKIEVTIDK